MPKHKSQYKTDSGFLSGNFIKVVLAIIAISSFGLAFYYDQVSTTLVKLYPIGDKKCLEQFYKNVPPYLNKESLQRDTYPLCFNGFNLMYSGVSKTPLWVAERLTVQRLSQNVPREVNFHEEERIPLDYRSKLSDYRGSGYIRWRLAPNADMPNKTAQFDSFSLANIAPVANLEVLTKIEYLIRGIAIKKNQDVYVVTGPVFATKKLKTIGRGVIVPTATYKAIYMPKTGVAGVYYAENTLKNTVPQVQVISVCALEDLTGINIFPQLEEDQKRNTYSLPLSPNDLASDKEIEYSYWDAESQCATDISEKDISMLQKKFSFE